MCEIYTDVDGVFSGDPRMVPDAHRWSEISFEVAIEMASSGARVLHPRAAEVCMALWHADPRSVELHDARGDVDPGRK